VTSKFDISINSILNEASGDDSDLPDFGQSPDRASSMIPPDSTLDGGGGASDDIPEEGEEEQQPDNSQLKGTNEELEYANMAVRALNFNTTEYYLLNHSLMVNGESFSVASLSDFFERTKQWKAVIQFIDWIINKFEGGNTQWVMDQELAGAPIITRLKAAKTKDEKGSNAIDNPKRVLWTRIILNCFLNNDHSFNLNSTDVTLQSIPDILNLLKQHFNRNTRGLFSINLRGPGQ